MYQQTTKPKQEIIFKTSEIAYAVDRKGKIVAWNRAAENIFGYPDHEALGKKCWDLLCGKDSFGNQYCCEGCPVLNLAFDNKSGGWACISSHYLPITNMDSGIR